jgi:hypothetical protein
MKNIEKKSNLKTMKEKKQSKNDFIVDHFDETVEVSQAEELAVFFGLFTQ